MQAKPHFISSLHPTSLHISPYAARPLSGTPLVCTHTPQPPCTHQGPGTVKHTQPGPGPAGTEGSSDWGGFCGRWDTVWAPIAMPPQALQLLASCHPNEFPGPW